MSAETDRKFFDTFMVVLGALVVIAFAIYGLAGWIADRSQANEMKGEPVYQRQVEARIEPVMQVAVAGRDNSDLRDPGGRLPEQDASGGGAAGDSGAATTAAMDGEGVYNSACTACHGAGIAGAPKTGDADAWGPRLDKGMDTLVRHAIEGFQGDAGYMPPRGGNSNLSDEQVREAVQYMVDTVEN